MTSIRVPIRILTQFESITNLESKRRSSKVPMLSKKNRKKFYFSIKIQLYISGDVRRLIIFHKIRIAQYKQCN